MANEQTKVRAKDRLKLERGMLLLGGALGTPGEKLNRIWSVARVNQRDAVLICHTEEMMVEAKLRPPTLPDGWLIIDNQAAASVLRRPAVRDA